MSLRNTPQTPLEGNRKPLNKWETPALGLETHHGISPQLALYIQCNPNANANSRLHGLKQLMLKFTRENKHLKRGGGRL